MDAISGGALLAPSGDYVLLAPSGDYNQSIPPKSTNRIRCFTSRTVLLPTSAKLTRGIWEINRGEILVVTVFKNIQEHSMKFKNIRGYSNGKIKFKNIQDFRRPVRTLSRTLSSLLTHCWYVVYIFNFFLNITNSKRYHSCTSKGLEQNNHIIIFINGYYV